MSARRLAWVVVLVAGALRLALAALYPLQPDETYYWEWSRHLAGGYFDHPYGVALLVRAGTLVFGDTSVGVRFFPIVAGIVASFATVGIARRLGGDRAALVAALVMSCMPLAAAGLVLATPDAPLMGACAVMLYAVVRALAVPARSRAALGWWLVAGVALGAAMSSKFTAALVLMGVLIAVVARRDLRERLAEPGPYVASGIALLVFLPVILWNARHGWIAFGFQLQHGLGGAPRGTILSREGEMLGAQAGLVSPILFVMMAIAVWAALRSRRGAVGMLAIVATFVFAFFVYSAAKKKVEPNWPAPAYIAATALVALHAWGVRGRRWLNAGLVLGALVGAVVYVDAVTPILPVPPRRDQLAKAFGWDSLARAMEEEARSAGATGVWFAADRYQDASEVAFHMRDHPFVFSLNLAGRGNQYDLWPGFPVRAAAGDALVVALDESEQLHEVVKRLAPYFASVRRGPLVPLTRAGAVVTTRRLWTLEGWRGGWPASVQR